MTKDHGPFGTFSPRMIYAAIFLLVLFLLYFTWTREVYSFDGFCYMFLGKSISTGSQRVTNLFFARAPLISLLFGCIFLCLPFLSTAQIISCIGFFCLFLTLGMLFLAYRLYRRAFSSTWAIALMCLLLMNRMVLHYASEPMTDILPALWILGAYVFYQKALVQTKRYFFITGLLLGLAFASRQVAALAAVGFSLSYLLTFVFDPAFRSKTKGLSLLWGLSCLSILPCVVGLFFYSWVFYFFTDRINPLAFFLQFKFLKSAVGNLNPINDQPYEYLIYLIKSGGAVVAALILWGLFWSFRHWKRDGVLALVCLLFLGYLSLGMKHKEARYLLPVLPILYYFLGRGWMEIRTRFASQQKGLALLTFLIFASAGYVCALEILTLRDPFYQKPFAKRVSKYIKTRLQNKKPPIYYLRYYYGLYPKNYPDFYHFSHYDEYYHFYHLSRYPFELYTGEKIERLRGKIHPNRYPTRDRFFFRDSLSHFPPETILIYGHFRQESSISQYRYSIPLVVGQIKTERLKPLKQGLGSEHFYLTVKKNSSIEVEKAIFPFDLYSFKNNKRIYLGCVIDSKYIVLPGEAIPRFLEGPLKKVLSSGPSLLAVYQKNKKFYRDKKASRTDGFLNYLPRKKRN